MCYFESKKIQIVNFLYFKNTNRFRKNKRLKVIFSCEKRHNFLLFHAKKIPSCTVQYISLLLPKSARLSIPGN